MPDSNLNKIREFWEVHPVADSSIANRKTWYDYFRSFDNLRESEDVETYEFSNRVRQYETSHGQWVLDYGCGNGYEAAQYARNGAHVVGVDLTRRAIELTRRRFSLLEISGFFFQNNGLSVPFKNGVFDIVCCLGVLHHIPDPQPVVQEMFRVLKPGGKLILMVYNRNSYRYYVTFTWRRLRGAPKFRGKTQAQMICSNDGAGNPYGTVYTKEQLRGLLADFRDHSFIVNKLGLAEIALWSPRMTRFLDWITPRKFVRALARTVGWNLYASAYKADADGICPPADADNP